MAALTGITAVRPTVSTKHKLVKYGATIAAGIPVYLDVLSQKYLPADSNASAVAAGASGITITPSVDNGYGYIAIDEPIVLVGATMAVGETYYVGATAGQIIPSADLATGDFVTRLGTAAATNQLNLSIQATGVQRA